jgi:phosphate transport system substrate-binding protein
MKLMGIFGGALAAAAIATSSLAADITGAGATFPYPIYAKWADAYKKSTGNGMNYQSIGSGGGIKQITAKTVDFGASDMPMKADDLRKNGLVQFPAIMGGVVPVYKLEGIGPGQLKFTGALLADIYLGKVAKWNDPAIAKLNPGVKLPTENISVVHRSDGSGTTFLWSNYLSKASPDFKTAVGEGTSVKWPTGVGGKGNEGVASYVQKINGAIGYVEYAYAKQNKLPYGQVQNKAGSSSRPTTRPSRPPPRAPTGIRCPAWAWSSPTRPATRHGRSPVRHSSSSTRSRRSRKRGVKSSSSSSGASRMARGWRRTSTTCRCRSPW